MVGITILVSKGTTIYIFIYVYVYLKESGRGTLTEERLKREDVVMVGDRMK